MPVALLADRIAASLAKADETTAWRWLAQFADDYRGSSARGRAWLLEQAPRLTGDRRYDAALAALVEHLCAESDTAAPAWTSELSRFAEPWWFPAALPALEATMLRDSPISFKRHGVFVGSNAFHRV